MNLRSYIDQIYSLEKEIAQLYREQERLLEREKNLTQKLDRESETNTENLDARQKANFLFKFEKSKKELQSIKKGLANTTNRLAERNRIYGIVKIEYEKMENLSKQTQRDMLKAQKEITKQLEKQKEIIISSRDVKIKTEEFPYDFFISHATEDKPDFVKPLAESLIKNGARVWYDEFSLTVGDSLRRSIDKGLKSSKYGVVILSNSFFNKQWAQYELDALVTREMNGSKTILPIWHRVTKDEVQNFSYNLADKLALNSSVNTVEEISSTLLGFCN